MWYFFIKYSLISDIFESVFCSPGTAEFLYHSTYEDADIKKNNNKITFVTNQLVYNKFYLSIT